MYDVAMEVELPLFERVYDLKRLFRKLDIQETDQWRNIAHIQGELRRDTRMKMGRGAAAHSAQSLRMLLIRMVMGAAVVEGWGMYEASIMTSMKKMTELCHL